MKRITLNLKKGDVIHNYKIIKTLPLLKGEKKLLCENISNGVVKSVYLKHLETGMSTGFGNVGKLSPSFLHGKTNTREWQIWQNMLNRCNNKKNSAFKNYGGRGITVCKEWDIFNGFWDDMKDSYEPHLTLDRINNNKGYSKENCRWSTMSEQGRNKRSNIVITYNGETKTLKEWSECIGINYMTLYGRFVTYKMPIERCLEKGLHKKGRKVGFLFNNLPKV